MDNNNLFNQGNQNGEQGQPYQNADGQYQPQQPYQNADGQYQPQQPYQNADSQYQQQQPYQSMDTQFQKQPYNQYQPQQPYNQYQLQQPYNQYQQQQPCSPDSELEEPMSFADWMVTLLLMYIPCVNIIVLLVWAFGSGTKKTKSNFARANLVWMLISAVVSTIVVVMYIGAIMAAIDSGAF